MNCWPCFSTVTFMIGFSGSLSYSPSVGLLSWALWVGSFLMLSGAVALLVAHFGIPSFAKASMTKLWFRMCGAASHILNWGKKKNDRGSVPLGAMFLSIFIVVLLLWGVTHQPPFQTYEYHNVKVLAQVARNKWTLEREDGTRTLYTACNDFQNDKVIWAGFVAKMIRYEDQGTCNSILKPGLGFYWDRDERANVRRIE